MGFILTGLFTENYFNRKILLVFKALSYGKIKKSRWGCFMLLWGKNKIFKVIIVTLTMFIVVMLFIIGGALVYAAVNVDFEADEALFSAAREGNTTRLYYDNSGHFGSDISEYQPEELEVLGGAGDRRDWFSFDEISSYVKAGFLAVEDREFYEHGGVNLRRTLAAVINYVFGKDTAFGGSTITQQVIKNISGDNERTVKRKLFEIIRAYHLEYKHTKDEIFEAYLNVIPMGEGVTGVGLAAREYFGKLPSELTIHEAATLVGITNAPTRYNPYLNYDACLAKRNVVLGAMREVGYISEADYLMSVKEPIVLNEREEGLGGVLSWYAEAVIDELCLDLMRSHGYSEGAARLLISNGGLKIYTTIDPLIQNTLEEYFENPDNFPKDISNGMKLSMVITSADGADLRAIVGSVGEKRANRLLNYATVNITPASTLKPHALYAPLIESGKITWSTVFDDAPLRFIGEGEDIREYPYNSPMVYNGLINVSSALKYSKNTVALRLFALQGVSNTYKHLKNNYGFKILNEDIGESQLAFGQLTDGIPLRNLTEAYTVFSSGGVLYSGRSYVACYKNDGTLLLDKKSEGRRVYSESTAKILTKMLEGVVEDGTASKIRLKEIVDTAGKTGTSSGSREKLFVGFTPYYAAGIWCGYEKRNESVSGSAHITVWDEVMTKIHRRTVGYGEEIMNFDTSGLVLAPYCVDSGKLFSPECVHDARGSRVSYGYFTRESVPRERCDTHVLTLDGGRMVSYLMLPPRQYPKDVWVLDEIYRYKKEEYGE